MGRKIGRLSALAVSRAKTPGYFPDGGGLYLQVASGNARSWILRFTLAGRVREMGLGALHAIPLAEARKRAQAARALLAAGIDPIDERRARLDALKAEHARRVAFDEAAKLYVEANKAGWRNAKHGQQWLSSLQAYASPIFGALSVRDIDTALVAKAIEPIWTDKTETASRVRGRIESILDWAKTRGYRSGENPARWKGHLENILPPRSKVRRVQHHPALPYPEIGAFMAALRRQEGIAAISLEFVILTACRTSEAIGATWDEIDLDAATWTIPAKRIKAEREHRVPLSPRAVEILRLLREKRTSRWLFPGDKPGLPLSNMAMLALLERMGRAEQTTVHGLRSSFRDWAAERTNYPREIAEKALAHLVGDETERSYQRGDLFEKRRRLMRDWAKFCAAPQKGGAVVPMRSAK